MPHPYLQRYIRSVFLVPLLMAGAICIPSVSVLASSAHVKEEKAVPQNRIVSLKAPGTTYSELLTFNSGWRWVYRKKVVERLVKDVISDDNIVIGALGSLFSVEGADREKLLAEARKTLKTLHEDDQSGEAVLENIIACLESYEVKALDEVLRVRKDSGFHGAGYLLLGRYYEKKGFYPEANGYYILAKKSGRTREFREAALFLSGRAQFFIGRLSGAKKTFEASMSNGNPLARRWLAATDLVRGEVDLAWELFSDSTGFVPLDPVVRLAMADAMAAKGAFEPAYRVFAELETFYKDDQIISAFFGIRKADALLAEGRVEDAEASYVAMKQRSKAEPWAMASLALADALSMRPDEAARKKAIKLYSTIADGAYIGTEAAYLGLVRTHASVGEYEDAATQMKRFLSRFPASALRPEMKDLGGRAISDWTDELFKAGDYYGVAKLDAIFASEIPFGKKAQAYLKAGVAASELGLLETAVRHLNMAVKVGSDDAAEKAMVTLAGVYLRQKDWGSAERMLDVHQERFKKGSSLDAAKKMRAAVYALKGDRKAVASIVHDPSDPASFMRKAEALSGLGRYSDSFSHYEKAVRMFRAAGMDDLALDASVRGADVLFASGDYKAALKAYKEAASRLRESAPSSSADRSWVLYRLGQCYSNLGMKDELISVLGEIGSEGGEIKPWAEVFFKDTGAQNGKRSGI